MALKTPIVKNVTMDWETERHTFTFVTCKDKLVALDMLGDFIGSLRDLYCHIAENYSYGDDMPNTLKIKGSPVDTYMIDGKAVYELKRAEA